jgi:ABC-type Fe3+-hydroxamate transport system substrate-binding protein
MSIISLVPSATETMVALGVQPIACTRFCDLPGVQTVGGTKNPEIGAIVALRPDLVVVNDEENRIEDARALEDAGCRLHSMSPRRVEDVPAAVDALADALGVEPQNLVVSAPLPHSGRAFVATWRRPYMTLNDDTYGASVLAWCGYENVFGDEGERYPEVTLADVAARNPDLVLLPDEPYPFSERHVPEMQDATPGARVAVVDGRDLFWWGIRTPDAIERLQARFSR